MQKTCKDCRNYQAIDRKMGLCSFLEKVVEWDDEICEQFDDAHEAG